MIHFHVPGKPVGKARPRMTRRGHVYTPAKTKDYEAAIRAAFIKAAKTALVSEQPVSMDIQVRILVPKSWPKWKRERAPREPHLQKPDADNIEKVLMDALNGLAYRDDAQVWKKNTTKTWTGSAEAEGLWVTIEYGHDALTRRDGG